jgi:hypothetical protein
MIRLIAIRSISKAVGSTALDMTAFGFSSDELNGADYALLTAYSANIRYSMIGPAVVASGGHLVEANKDRYVGGKENVNALTVIAESGSPTLTISLFKATEGAL